jgi:MFS family permease
VEYPLPSLIRFFPSLISAMNQPRSKAFVLSFIGICCWNFNAAIEATSFSVSLPVSIRSLYRPGHSFWKFGNGLITQLQVIVREVHATNIQGFWSVTSFQVFSTVFQPISASASKNFGRKAIVLLGLTLFTAGAIIASVAHNVALLLLGRSVQGAGAGTLMTMSFLVLTDLVSLRERGKWVGMMSLVWLVGSVAGPIIGGVFSQKVTWVSSQST